jgi:NADH-quinone oxidoreductase subunit J
MNSFPASNLLLTVIFLFCLATLGTGALLAVFSARLIRSVCGLAVCSVGLGGLYYFLHSPFLALMEILIYIGAVCVTIVFAVMLAEPEEPANEEKRTSTFFWGGMAIAVALAIFCSAVWLGANREWMKPATLLTDGSLRAIGIALLTTYSLAFELISLALLVAILGALAIARTGRTKPPLASTPIPAGHDRPTIMPDPELVASFENDETADALALPSVLGASRLERPVAESRMPEGNSALTDSRFV